MDNHSKPAIPAPPAPNFESDRADAMVDHSTRLAGTYPKLQSFLVEADGRAHWVSGETLLSSPLFDDLPEDEAEHVAFMAEHWKHHARLVDSPVVDDQ